MGSFIVSILLIVLLLVSGCSEILPHDGKLRSETGEETDTVEMIWPVRGPIVSPFRPPSRPNHQGLDFAAPPGTAVIAASPGRVSFVGRIPGYGNVVAVEHERQLTTVYSHLADGVQARQGTRVFAGETIARVGPEGYLHFEIRREKTAVDPARYYRHAASSEEAPVPARAEIEAEPHEAVPIAPPLAPPQPADGSLKVADLPPIAARPGVDAPLASPGAAPTPPPLERSAEITEAAGLAAARVEPAPAPVPPLDPPSPPAASDGGVLGASAEPLAASANGFDGSLVAGLVVTNFFWVPPKLAYSIGGGIVGVFAYALTGGAVSEVLDETLGGDYVITPEHLRGDRPLRFRGS